MIVVKGEVLLLPPSGLQEQEQEIFQLKKEHPKSYSYGSIDMLRFELKTRRLLVEAAEALNSSGVQFAVYEKSQCNEKYWHRDQRGGFLLKPAVTPAEGIRNIFDEGHLYAFECATAMVIVLYKGMLDALGETLFNLWFGGLLLYDWHYDKDLHLVDSGSIKEAFPGDVLYFKNPDVLPATPEWQGENVLKLGTDRYYGHGISIKSAAEVIEALNRKRRPGSQVSAYLTDIVVHPDYPVLYRSLIGSGDGAGMNNGVNPLWGRSVG